MRYETLTCDASGSQGGMESPRVVTDPSGQWPTDILLLSPSTRVGLCTYQVKTSARLGNNLFTIAKDHGYATMYFHLNGHCAVISVIWSNFKRRNSNYSSKCGANINQIGKITNKIIEAEADAN